MKTDFPDPDDTLNFTLTIEPDEGMYKGGRFHFTFAISQGFPHEAPKVKCTQKIYHPNIDLEGNVCLNILREDWKPVLNLQAVIVGLQARSSNLPQSVDASMLTTGSSSSSSSRMHQIPWTKKQRRTCGPTEKASSATFGQLWEVGQSRTRPSRGFW
jgi:ubiquitin-protein ligase